MACGAGGKEKRVQQNGAVMASIGFHLKNDSKLRNSSEVQLQALKAIRAAGPNGSGIVILPCGAGKTSVFLQTALEAGRRVLFLCYEKQGVMQVAETIQKETVVNKDYISVYTSDVKKEPNYMFCYMVATYGMFSGVKTNRARATKETCDFVLHKAKWDAVILDETHHAGAATYRPLVEKLQKNAKRVLGFTGTLCRNEIGSGRSADDARERATQMAEHFLFIGPVLFSRTPLQLERKGLISKVSRMEVQTRLTPAFELASKLVSNPSTKKYVEGLHPEKLNALWILVNMHIKMGDVGMVFVNHLLHAKIVQELLGDKWEILSGSNAHGDDGKHSAETNAEIVARFNSGKLRGVVSTPVGESALDAVNPDFRYAIVIDAHSGPASASQKLGRLSRTKRLPPVVGETADAYEKRCLEVQKKASYYEIVTLDTEEMTAAANRHAQFEQEGYSHRSMTYAQVQLLHQRFVNADGPLAFDSLPYSSTESHARLLVNALKYTDLGVADKTGVGHARQHKKAHQQNVKSADKKSKEAKHALFRDRHKAQHNRLQKRSSAVNEKAKEIRKMTVASTPLSATVLAVLRQIKFDPNVLRAMGIVIPNDDERDEADEAQEEEKEEKEEEEEEEEEEEKEDDSIALPDGSTIEHLHPSEDEQEDWSSVFS